MKRLTIVASMLLVAATGMTGAGDARAAGSEAPAVVKQTVCPIMGGKINPDLYVDHDGKRLYVCCNMCLGTAKKDPAKYIKQLEAQGITLDRVPQAATTNAPATAPRPAPEKHPAAPRGVHTY